MEKGEEKNTIEFRSSSNDHLNIQRPFSHISYNEMNTVKSMTNSLSVVEERERDKMDTICIEIPRDAISEFGEQSSESLRQQNLTTSRSFLSGGSQASITDENSDGNEELSVPIDFPFSSSCIECVKPYRLWARSNLSEGDHIIIFGVLYDHHAIVAKISPDDEDKSNEGKAELTLIHATNTGLRALIGISKIFGGKAKIQETTQCLDFEKNYTMVVKYLKPRYSPSEIVERAKNQIREQTFRYNLFGSNCEHFATYCVTNERFSVQVRKLSMTLKMFFTRRFAGLSDEKLRNQVAHERGLLCKPCFERNEKLLAAEKRPLLHRSEVSEGDIITFSYWNLYHDAVVVKVHKTNAENTIDLTIVHYAFCGIFHHNTIKEERKTFPLNGSVRVTVYNSPPYNVYSTEETIERARSRKGEQQFSFFANDSSHFARWSKLKLKLAKSAN